MKNIVKNISLTLALSGWFLIGCESDLQENPQTFVNPDVFYANTESFERSILGVYRNVPSSLNSNSFLTLESFSDIIGSVSSSYEQGLPVYQNDHQPFFYNVSQLWSTHYAMIKDANFVIKKLEEASTDVISASDKNTLSAEAKFLRGYSYFHLVQLFGDVPLRTSAIESFDDVKIPRSPQADVYKLILDDLTFAESNLPDNAKVTGRVYKLVASALLAKVYLTMAGNPLNQTQYYTNARDKALQVINSGKFALVSDYSKVFHNTKYTSESIWEQTFQSGIGGNPLMSLSATALGYTYILPPAEWFVESFPKGDQRKEWGVTENFESPSGTLAPFFTKFVNTDWLAAGYTTSQAGLLEYTIPILRLGEMYLIAAEAENEISGPDNAYKYINAIRARARVDKSDANNVPDLKGLSQAEFRNAVWMERKWELHLEGSTWYDLKRTNTFQRIQEVRPATLVRPIGAYNQTWYIPLVEIQNNDIPQNPLYP